MAHKGSKLALFLVVFVDLLGFGIMIPMLPFFARSLEATATEIGILMTVYSGIQVVISPFWGSLSDRFGRRPILLITIAGQGLAFLWAGFSITYSSLLLSRIFAGFFAANISTASATMADITLPEERAKGMGLIGAAFGLGFVFGPAIGALAISFGYAWPARFAALLCLANLILAFVILKEPVRQRTGDNQRLSKIQLYRKILMQAKFSIPTFVFFFLTFAFVQVEIIFGLFVLDRFHLSESQAGFLLAFMGLIMALVQGVFLGRLTNRFGERMLIIAGIFINMMGLFLLIFSFNWGVLLFSLIFIGGGLSLANPALSSKISRAAPEEHQGTVLGVYQSGASLARVLGPLVAGALYDSRIVFPLILATSFVIVAELMVLFSRVLKKT